MNVTVINAQFTMSTHEVIKLKFENKLDDIVKHNLAIKLAYEILENNLSDLQPIENKYGNYETVFSVTLFVHK